MIVLSNVFHKNQQAFKDKIRYIINQGGTSSSKSFSILQLLTDIARKQPYKIDILGQSVPHLRDGVLTDMPTVCKGLELDFHNNFNKSEKIYTPGQGTMNFLSIDKLGKAHGGRRDILFINEANHIHWAIAEQLMIRTRKAIFIDYNPTSKFWAHTKILENEKDKSLLIKSTYRDNPCLEQTIIDAIEARRGDGNNNFWRVYGEGEIGRSEGLIFDNFEIDCNFDKESFEHYRHGVDWGFSIDPFCYVRLAIDIGRMEIHICDEIYGRNMQNTDTAPQVEAFAKGETVFCDCAEPKSISEYQSLGVNSEGAKKGQGSVESGIKYLQRFKIRIHKDCPNIAAEFMNYAWKVNKITGEPLNMPNDTWNHGIDATRYAVNADIDGNNSVGIHFI